MCKYLEMWRYVNHRRYREESKVALSGERNSEKWRGWGKEPLYFAVGFLVTFNSES